MTCYSPLQGYRSAELTKNGKRKIVFSPNSALGTSKLFQVEVPCGQCIGCKLRRSREWAIRCMHEASLYESNCFITLTYDDYHLPEYGNLQISDFQKFMKRLRKRFGDGIRFYHCGEYGEKFGRPHYHACLFNFDFPDKYNWRERNGHKFYRSPTLERLWPFGLSDISDVTFESAAYVARYLMKKVYGDWALTRYAVVDEDTGEVIFDKQPEYTTMSRKPGIGKTWYDQYKFTDVYDHDSVVTKSGLSFPPPKYYDSLFEIEYPEDFARIKDNRKLNAKRFASNNTPERLHVRRVCKELAVKRKLVRTLDEEL